MISDAENLTHNMLGRLFRTEVSIIRCYRQFLMSLPVHGSSAYQAGSKLLVNRLLGSKFTIASDSAYTVENRQGSLLIPRANGRDVHWNKFMVAVLDGDTNVIPDNDPIESDTSIFGAGEKVTFLNNQIGIYNPAKVNELRNRCIDAQSDYLLHVFTCSMMFPEFVSIYFGLNPTIVDSIKDLGVSSLKQITDLVLFPRYISFSPNQLDDGSSIPSKVHTWAYEIAADVKLGIVNENLMELLRYDTLFISHRQEIFNTLANNFFLRD